MSNRHYRAQDIQRVFSTCRLEIKKQEILSELSIDKESKNQLEGDSERFTAANEKEKGS